MSRKLEEKMNSLFQWLLSKQAKVKEHDIYSRLLKERIVFLVVYK